MTEGIRLTLAWNTRGHSVVPVYSSFGPNVPVARAQPGGEPRPGVDSRAAPRSQTTGQGCRLRRARNDCTHSSEIVECGYPYEP